MRSRLSALLYIPVWSRIISACAEQTWPWTGRRSPPRDHLRVCGADLPPYPSRRTRMGSSPRVRSRPVIERGLCRRRGIISACAEQTHPSSCRRARNGDHLRVCGADVAVYETFGWVRGSSPRVRSRLEREISRRLGERIISACAEQTSCSYLVSLTLGDHLRVCGADDGPYEDDPDMPGSSPRVRSRRLQYGAAPPAHGIISACAEQTSRRCGRGAGTGDHLRVCGADLGTVPPRASRQGSSPRVRSRHEVVES